MTNERSPTDVGRQLRGRGLLLGAAVGDALGWPQEQRSGIVGGARSRNVKAQATFREWRRNSGTQFGRYIETVSPGEYSDDTQLLLAVARACNRGEDWFEHLTRVELPAWLAYQRGGGRAVLTAARAWLRGHPPWVAGSKQVDPAKYFAAGANGVAMRVGPHALGSCDRDPEDLIARVIKDGIATHGHPRALVGAAIHALTLWFVFHRSTTLSYGELLEHLQEEPAWKRIDLSEAAPRDWLEAFQRHAGQSAHVVWERTVEEVQGLLNVAGAGLRRGALADDVKTLGELGCFDRTISGAGTVTAVAALYLTARAAARPLSGLLAAAFLRDADTDTLASMVGSTLGALHGPDWLGDLAITVQDSAYIESFAFMRESKQAVRAPAELFSAHAVGQSRDVQRVSNRDMTRFVRELDSGAKRDGAFVDGRSFTIEERFELESRTKASVTRFRLRLGDGQTIVVDRVRRATEGDADAPGHSIAESGHSDTSVHRRVTVLVRDLAAMASFYRNVLGLPVRGRGDGTVDIGSYLRLQSDATLPSGPRGIVIEVETGNLARLRRMLGIDEGAASVLEITDPEGNRVVVRSARR